MSLAKVIKKDSVLNGNHAIIPSQELRSYLVTERQALLIKLANLERLLGLSRKCKSCGNVL